MKKMRVTFISAMILMVVGCDKQEENHTPAISVAKSNNDQAKSNKKQMVSNPKNDNDAESIENDLDINLEELDRLTKTIEMTPQDEGKNTQINSQNRNNSQLSAYSNLKDYSDDKNSALVISKLLTNSYAIHVEKMYWLTKRQKSCIGKPYFPVDEVDKILRKQLSATEYNELLAFNKSDIGKKFPDYADYLLNGVTSMLSSEDFRMIRKFRSTKAGNYMDSLKSNEAFLVLYRKTAERKFTSCGATLTI